MIYITQIIHIKSGEEAAFNEFESHAIPLMEEFGGKMIYRIKPTESNFITAEGELPYEIHFLSFESESKLEAFLKDKRRTEHIHLKEQSIKSTFLVKGQAL